MPFDRLRALSKRQRAETAPRTPRCWASSRAAGPSLLPERRPDAAAGAQAFSRVPVPVPPPAKTLAAASDGAPRPPRIPALTARVALLSLPVLAYMTRKRTVGPGEPRLRFCLHPIPSRVLRVARRFQLQRWLTRERCERGCVCAGRGSRLPYATPCFVGSFALPPACARLRLCFVGGGRRQSDLEGVPGESVTPPGRGRGGEKPPP